MARGHPDTWIDRNGNEHTLRDCHRAMIDEYLANGYNTKLAYETIFGKPDPKSAKSGSIFWREDCQEYLKHERQRLFDEKNVDKLRVMDRLCDIAFAEKGDPDYNTNNQLKALEMLAKMGDMFDLSKNNGNNIIRITLDK